MAQWGVRWAGRRTRRSRRHSISAALSKASGWSKLYSAVRGRQCTQKAGQEGRVCVRGVKGSTGGARPPLEVAREGWRGMAGQDRRHRHTSPPASCPPDAAGRGVAASTSRRQMPLARARDERLPPARLVTPPSPFSTCPLPSCIPRAARTQSTCCCKARRDSQAHSSQHASRGCAAGARHNGATGTARSGGGADAGLHKPGHTTHHPKSRVLASPPPPCAPGGLDPLGQRGGAPAPGPHPQPQHSTRLMSSPARPARGTPLPARPPPPPGLASPPALARADSSGVSAR